MLVGNSISQDKDDEGLHKQTSSQTSKHFFNETVVQCYCLQGDELAFDPPLFKVLKQCPSAYRFQHFYPPL